MHETGTSVYYTPAASCFNRSETFMYKYKRSSNPLKNRIRIQVGDGSKKPHLCLFGSAPVRWLFVGAREPNRNLYPKLCPMQEDVRSIFRGTALCRILRQVQRKNHTGLRGHRFHSTISKSVGLKKKKRNMFLFVC